MNKLIFSVLAACSLLLGGCYQIQMQRQARNSNVVVLDIGHYYHPERGGQGARTPDAKYGSIEETEFWYRYAIYVKQEIEAAGYQCIICNRGATPTNARLAAAGKRAGVHQINSEVVTGVYRSSHHPDRMAVGMRSADYALDQKPAAVIFLHHNSNSESWLVCNKGAFYCNEEGVGLARTMAKVMNTDIMNVSMPNNGVPCGIVLRNDGRKGGGDWLNTCDDSYVPAVITEVAYLSNPEHAQYLSKHENAVKFSRAIGKGVVTYLKNR